MNIMWTYRIVEVDPELKQTIIVAESTLMEFYFTK